MNNKRLVMLMSILICISFVQITILQGAETFKETDDTNDIKHYVDYDWSYTDDDFSEIDISSLEIDGTSIIITFVGLPVADDVDYLYTCNIFWVGDDPLGNFTKIWYSNESSEIYTRIENSTGGEIIDDKQYDLIYINEHTLVIPIQFVGYIPNVLDPETFFAKAEYEISETNYYLDDFYYDIDDIFPGFGFWITLVSLSTLVIVAIIIKRYKS